MFEGYLKVVFVNCDKRIHPNNEIFIFNIFAVSCLPSVALPFVNPFSDKIYSVHGIAVDDKISLFEFGMSDIESLGVILDSFNNSEDLTPVVGDRLNKKRI